MSFEVPSYEEFNALKNAFDEAVKAVPEMQKSANAAAESATQSAALVSQFNQSLIDTQELAKQADQKASDAIQIANGLNSQTSVILQMSEQANNNSITALEKSEDALVQIASLTEQVQNLANQTPTNPPTTPPTTPLPPPVPSAPIVITSTDHFNVLSFLDKPIGNINDFAPYINKALHEASNSYLSQSSINGMDDRGAIRVYVPVSIQQLMTPVFVPQFTRLDVEGKLIRHSNFKGILDPNNTTQYGYGNHMFSPMLFIGPAGQLHHVHLRIIEPGVGAFFGWHHKLQSCTVKTGGGNYKVGELVTFNTNNLIDGDASKPVLRVSSVNSSGAVTGVSLAGEGVKKGEFYNFYKGLPGELQAISSNGQGQGLRIDPTYTKTDPGSCQANTFCDYLYVYYSYGLGQDVSGSEECNGIIYRGNMHTFRWLQVFGGYAAVDFDVSHDVFGDTVYGVRSAIAVRGNNCHNFHITKVVGDSTWFSGMDLDGMRGCTIGAFYDFMLDGNATRPKGGSFSNKVFPDGHSGFAVRVGARTGSPKSNDLWVGRISAKNTGGIPLYVANADQCDFDRVRSAVDNSAPEFNNFGQKPQLYTKGSNVTNTTVNSSQI